MNEIRNIPGLWTSVFHWAGYMFYILLLPRQAEKKLILFVSAVMLVLQTALYTAFVADRDGLYFNIMNVLFALWTLVPFLLFTAGSIWNKVYFCARGYILGAFSASLFWQLYSLYIARLSCLSGPVGEAASGIFLGALVFSAAYLIERPHLRVDGEMRLRPGMALSVVLLSLAAYILSSLSYAAKNVPFTASRDAEIYSLRTLTYFCGLAILFTVHIQNCDAYVNTEKRAMETVLETQYRNYRAMQDSIDIINRKYHDLKHQIAILRSGLDTEKKTEYLDQVEREISAYEAQNKTGNEVLDTILTGKSQQCRAEGISFTCVADGHALDFLSVMDMSAIFGNALDNAIESVMKIENPEMRLIHLTVSVQRQFVSIVVRNRYRDEPVMREGLPLTTKKEKNLHGYGVKSIKSTAEKYGGTASVGTGDGWFELSVLLPRSGGK